MEAKITKVKIESVDKKTFFFHLLLVFPSWCNIKKARLV